MMKQEKSPREEKLHKEEEKEEQQKESESVFVTPRMKRNTLQYYAWRVVFGFSLVLEHAGICLHLARKLFFFLVSGTRVWVFMVARLFAFIFLLLPGWFALLKYYLFDSFVIRNVEFGRGSRQRNLLDVYLPRPSNPGCAVKRRRHNKKEEGDNKKKLTTSSRESGKSPVIVFVSGGAWIIGYKLWSALMARELSRAGYVVVVPDYRNFPQGNIKNMILDIRAALWWTTTNCAMFGGDPNRIILAGQSAGAHISLCTLVELYEESLAKDMIKDIPLTSINLMKRTVSFSESNPVISARELELESDNHDNLLDCIWRDNMSSDVAEETGSEREVNDTTETTDGEDESLVPDNIDENQMAPQLTEPALLPEPMKAFRDSDFMEYSVKDRKDHSERIDTAPFVKSTSSQVVFEKNFEDDMHSLKISDIKMFIGISGPYNMMGLMDHLHERGLDVSILHYILAFDAETYSPTCRLAKLIGMTLPDLNKKCMQYEESSLSIYKYLFGGKDDQSKLRSSSIDDVDPSILPGHSSTESTVENFVTNKLRECYDQQYILKDFPTVALFHGSKDKSIPSVVSEELESVLQKGNVRVSSKIYPDMSHTDPILENVLEGDTGLVVDMINSIEDYLHADRNTVIAEAVDSPKSATASDSSSVNSQRCERYLHNNKAVKWPVSPTMMKLARMLNPF